MAISVMRPVEDRWDISGEYLQDWGYWTKEHPHMGIDYDCPLSTPVVSCTIRGDVYAIHNAPLGQWMGDFGLCIVVRVFDPTGKAWYFLYAHLSKVMVVVGETVNPGQLIGLSGDTGDVTGPHLHIQVNTTPQFARIEAETGDPQLWMREGQAPVPPVKAPPTGEEAWREVVALNEAIMLRYAIQNIAGDPDYERVKQAATALRKAGFVL